jgi:hypothetical protein
MPASMPSSATTSRPSKVTLPAPAMCRHAPRAWPGPARQRDSAASRA